MRSNNLERHIKKHERKPETEDNVATEMVQKSCTSENFMGLEKGVLDDWKEFDRKIELGQEVNKIVK